MSALLLLQRTAGNQAVTRTLARKAKTVFLTFDDGPRRETTPIALEALKEADVKATFYIQGNHIKGNEDLLYQIVKQGHSIGNHTFTHPTFSKDKKPLITDEQIVEEFTKTEDAIKTTLKAERAKAQEKGEWEKLPEAQRAYIDSIIAGGTRELRVPQFSQTSEQTAFISSKFVKPRAAHVDSKDADTIAREAGSSEEQKTAEVVRNVISGTPDGTHKGVADHPENPVVVLQHDTLPFSVKAIPEIVKQLKAQGHTFGERLPAREGGGAAPSVKTPPTPTPTAPTPPPGVLDSFWNWLTRTPTVSAKHRAGQRRATVKDVPASPRLR